MTPTPPMNLLRRRGFSFTEVMFAVIVLGIGFIMIAAIFPVAIQQGKLNSEETSATAVAREALTYLSQVGANSDSLFPDSQGGPLLPATGDYTLAAPGPYPGRVYSLRDPQPAGTGTFPLGSPPNPVVPDPANPGNKIPMNPPLGTPPVDQLYKLIKGSLIVPSDPRFAFVALYRRDGNPKDRSTWSPFAQVWLIPVTTRSRSTYTPAADVGTATAPPPGTIFNLQSRLVKVSIDLPTGGTYSINPTGGYVLRNWTTAASPYTPNSLVEGCYIIIANDQINAPLVSSVAVNAGHMNGRIYHVGGRRPDLDDTANSPPQFIAYDLAPDGDFVPDCGANGKFDPNPVGSTTPDPNSDDIVNIGVTTGTYHNASGPADAYILGSDLSTGTPTGKAQDISAFTTFIKVN